MASKKSKKKLSLLEVADIVDSEGLDYAITCYMSGDKIEDKNLAKLWGKAADILREIETILEEARQNNEETEE